MAHDLVWVLLWCFAVLAEFNGRGLWTGEWLMTWWGSAVMFCCID